MILKIIKKTLILSMCLLVILSFFGCGKKPIKNNTTSMQKNVQEDITKDNKQKNNEVVSHKNEMNDANKLLQEYYVMNAKKDKVIEKNQLSDFEKFKNMDPRFATTVTLTNLNQSPVTSLSKILNNLGLLLEIQSGVMLTQNIPYQYNGNLYNYLDVLCKLNGIGFDYSSGKIILKAFDTKTYDISFVNVVQEYGVNINSSTSGDTSAAATTQNFNLKTEMTKADLWEQIQNELKAIISNEGYFVVNKSVGTVTVTDRLPFFNKIDNYISTLTKRLSKEVFLDVKVLEITYNNTKEQGIDWNALSLARYDGNKIGIRSNFISGSPDVFTNGASGLSSLSLPVLTVTNQQDVINFIAGFVQGKGNLSIKSQPRQLVLNGQPAVIPVGQIIKYISSISSEAGQDSSLTSSGSLNYSLETGTIQTGVVLQFLPKITDENQIVLNLGVTLNRLDKMDEKSFSGITIQLPQTSVRAVSSTVKMNSGQTIVIGGILSDTVNDETTKVPLLGDIPILGNLFKYKKNGVTKTEMVIVISAHVIDLS